MRESFSVRTVLQRESVRDHGGHLPAISPRSIACLATPFTSSNGFGIEEVNGVAKHAMEHYFDFIAGGMDLTPVITHRFPLEHSDQAVLAIKDGRPGAVKVLLQPAA